MMSNQWKYLFGLLFLLFLSCNRAGEHEALFRQVESVMNKRPDSAMVLLETIQNPERLPERDWAYWALLTTQAKDKLYIRHTSDSVINRVVDYFDGFIFSAAGMKKRWPIIIKVGSITILVIWKRRSRLTMRLMITRNGRMIIN